jgi:LysM repeat protein
MLNFLFIFIISFSFNINAKILSKDKTYTVVKGDTLWDITESFLNDPFLWVDVWKNNPHITNPHLIYPGDVININYSASGDVYFSLRRKNKRLYRVKGKKDYKRLENKIDSRFDSSGFLRNKENSNSYKKEIEVFPKTICISSKDDFKGVIYKTLKEPYYTKSGSTVHIVEKSPKKKCIPGTMYDVIRKDKSMFYNILATVTVLGPSKKENICKAEVSMYYNGKINKGLDLIDSIDAKNIPSYQIRKTVIGKTYSPFKKFLNTGDSVFLNSKNIDSLKLGTLIYLYKIKDPLSKNARDPYPLAEAKVFHKSKKCVTAVITYAARPAPSKSPFTTRF